MALYGEGRGGAWWRETRGGQPRGHAVRFHPAAFVPFHRLDLGEQHSAAQRCAAHDMTGYDQFGKGEGSSTTRRDGMGWRWAGNSRASSARSLGPLHVRATL